MSTGKSPTRDCWQLAAWRNLDVNGRLPLYEPAGRWRPVGEQLVRLRVAAGLSQRWLAEQLGVSQNTIHRLETGLLRPSRASLSRIVAVIGGDEVELARLAGYGEVP